MRAGYLRAGGRRRSCSCETPHQGKSSPRSLSIGRFCDGTPLVRPPGRHPISPERRSIVGRASPLYRCARLARACVRRCRASLEGSHFSDRAHERACTAKRDYAVAEWWATIAPCYSWLGSSGSHDATMSKVSRESAEGHVAELNQPGASFDRRLGYADGLCARARLGGSPRQHACQFAGGRPLRPDRIALFAKTTFLISAMFLVATSVSDLLYRGKGFRYPPARATPWGRSSPSRSGLRAAEVSCFLRTHCKCSTSVLRWVCAGHLPSWGVGRLCAVRIFTAMLAVSHVSTSRSIIVPSVPQRTLFLAIASFGALVLARWQTPLASELIARGGPRGKVMLDVVLWSTAGCAVATIASKVIYGLREIAREARQLGQYLLEEKIGAGGMGEVYRARHAMLRRPTAVKLLVGDATEAQLVRFEREVQLTARLTHPNTISVYDWSNSRRHVLLCDGNCSRG